MGDRIGIGITTHNRPEVLRNTLYQLAEHFPYLPDRGKLVIVDDASTISIDLEEIQIPCNYWSEYRFDQNVGIARAKNKCLELLDDCDHIFLFDDDIYPIVENWWLPYIESGEPHLMYIFKDFATARRLDDTIELWRNDKIVAYSHARGPMLYLRREVLDKVGGMDPIFGKWGYEHPDYSNRIFNAGLSSYRYADVIDSHKLFYSHDEHETVITTVKGPERQAAIARNKEIYNSRIHSSQFVPYKENDKQNIVITTYLSTIADPQGRTFDPHINHLADMIFSVEQKAEMTPVVIHDCFEENNGMLPVMVFVKPTHNPYFQRWISIREYLIANRDNIGKVFCVDATDVEMLKDPFPHMEVGKLYTGDEPVPLNCPWIVNHHKHNKLQEMCKTIGDRTLLNAGLLGGDVETVIEFLTYLVDFYFIAKTDMHYHPNNRQAYDPGMTDMATFNYIAYSKFGDRLSHGQHVNTRFKAFEKENKTAWFRHK